MKKFTVKVGQKHIALGVRYQSSTCPVALAIQDALRLAGAKVDFVAVTGYRAFFTVKREDFCIVLPDNVYAAVRTYDKGGKMRSITFEARPLSTGASLIKETP